MTTEKVPAPAAPVVTTTPRTRAKPAAPRAAAPAKAAKVARPAVAKAAAPAPAAPAETKAKKPKLVRDSFTIPKDEYAAIDVLKERSSKLGKGAKKSELLRAGLKLLSALPDAALLEALQAVPSIKTGRPTKTEAKAESAPAPAVKPAKAKAR